MARGWESKSVEEQQSQAQQQTISQDEKDALKRQNAEKMRKIQGLKLNRARIREQIERSTNDRYKELLGRELEHLEQELKQLEG
jgi:hypothetical protein